MLVFPTENVKEAYENAKKVNLNRNRRTLSSNMCIVIFSIYEAFMKYIFILLWYIQYLSLQSRLDVAMKSKVT